MSLGYLPFFSRNGGEGGGDKYIKGVGVPEQQQGARGGNSISWFMVENCIRVASFHLNKTMGVKMQLC